MEELVGWAEDKSLILFYLESSDLNWINILEINVFAIQLRVTQEINASHIRKFND